MPARARSARTNGPPIYEIRVDAIPCNGTIRPTVTVLLCGLQYKK